MKILYVGPDYPGSNGTCWRNAFYHLGHEVLTVDDEKLTPPPATVPGKLLYKLRQRPPEKQIAELNRRIVAAAREFRPDLCFYIKAYWVLPETLAQTRTMGPNFAYMNDDMFVPGLATYTFRDNLRHMDCILTTKSYSVREYHAAGAPLAVYIPNAYDPSIHYPARPSREERLYYAAELGFIGNFHPWKADLLADVALRGWDLNIRIWGPGWQNTVRPDYFMRWRKWRRLRRCVRPKPLWCGEMAKAIQSTDIMLGLVLRSVRDLHTSRSFEIPACGGFMLAERTEEHRMYFEEDKEAVYFSSLQELIDKARFYLGHESLRTKIARAGYERCLRSGATYEDRVAFALEQYRKLRPRAVSTAAGVSGPVNEQ